MLRIRIHTEWSNICKFIVGLFYRLFILKSEVLAPSEGRQIRVRPNFLDVLGSLDALITKEKISGFLIYIYNQNFVNSSPLKLYGVFSSI